MSEQGFTVCAMTASMSVQFVIHGVYDLCYFLSVLYKIRMECLMWRPRLHMCVPLCDLLSANNHYIRGRVKWKP